MESGNPTSSDPSGSGSQRTAHESEASTREGHQSLRDMVERKLEPLKDGKRKLDRKWQQLRAQYQPWQDSGEAGQKVMEEITDRRCQMQDEVTQQIDEWKYQISEMPSFKDLLGGFFGTDSSQSKNSDGQEDK